MDVKDWVFPQRMCEASIAYRKAGEAYKVGAGDGSG
jgi:hypothetical protein